MNRVRVFKTIFAFFTCLPCVASACCAGGPAIYISFLPEYEMLTVPGINFAESLETRVGLNGDWVHYPVEYIPLNYDVSLNCEEKWQATLAADIGDLGEALAAQGNPEARNLVARYREMRISMKEQGTYGNGLSCRWYSEWKEPIPQHPVVSTEAVEDVLGKLPDEFRLYTLGAASYRAGDFDTAACYWQELLALPEAERCYRSVWAAYMLGRVWTDKDPLRAIECFELCRALASSGFPDSSALSGESLGWQARAETNASLFVLAIHRYYLAALTGSGTIVSLYTALSKALSAPEIDRGLILDPECRNLILVALESSYLNTALTTRAAVAISAEGFYIPADIAARTAMRLYRRGDFAAAERWSALAGPKQPVARWIQSK